MKILVVTSLEQELSEYAKQVFDQHRVDVVYTGVGKVNAALSTYTAINWYNPDYIFNYGTAEAIKINSDINGVNGVVEVSKVFQRDMLPSNSPHRGLAPFSKSMDLFIKNERDGHTCGTGDTYLDQDDEWVTQNASLVDMEAWAVAKAASVHGTPWRIYKNVTDSIHDITPENAENGSSQFVDIVLDFIQSREYN
jgi:adenosylhomocysteine nucleosidase